MWIKLNTHGASPENSNIGELEKYLELMISIGSSISIFKTEIRAILKGLI